MDLNNDDQYQPDELYDYNAGNSSKNFTLMLDIPS